MDATPQGDPKQPLPPRPPPPLSAVVRLPCQETYTWASHISSFTVPSDYHVTLADFMPFVHFLQKWLAPAPAPRSRPLKVLLYSADGYSESSMPALCLLMALRALTLPQAFLALYVEKRRSFCVYQSHLAVMRQVEQRLRASSHPNDTAPPLPSPPLRPAAKSVSFAKPPALPAPPLGEPSESPPLAGPVLPHHPYPFQPSPQQPTGRPRASTSPWLPSLLAGDHQEWFNDPRFDGNFPSRVLPFLYLGNLNHASNVYMLHALGITHVVSVGECALVPPTHPTVLPPALPPARGSLWAEERAGRIRVLDIQGVCDDGIDTLEPQLAPICDWIDQARADDGQVLVHCRVGVSRSATVTIAYVMKHLGLPLVDAYHLVRSRRLLVLIQPNLRLMYNLCAWEIKLARERAGDDEDRLQNALARTLNWPYLARELHALNEKYLR